VSGNVVQRGTETVFGEHLSGRFDQQCAVAHGVASDGTFAFGGHRQTTPWAVRPLAQTEFSSPLIPIGHGRITRVGQFLLRAGLTGFALWVVTLVVSGIEFVGGDSTLQRVGIILVVAVIFGLVNAIIKPIVQFISIPLYILTLGLIHIVINALMLWITSWITETTTHWGLYIDDFWWTAIWAAIVLSIVSWVLSLLVPDVKRTADR
jgi:putative membrane protein